MAHRKRSSRSHMAWVRSFKKNPRRRRARRNPWPVGGIVTAAANPRRRRRYHVGRRRARRNPPRVLGLTGLPPIQSVLYAGIGFAGVPMVEGFLTPMLPVSITATTIGKYAVRVGSVLGLSMVAKMVLGREAARMVAIGGGAYVLVTAVKDSGLIPGLGSYTPLLRRGGMGTYTRLNGYVQGQPNAPMQAQSSNVTASRFRRFS